MSSPISPQVRRPLLHTVTVTNNNCRAERDRSKKLALRGVQKRRELGLVAPDVKVSRHERAAYDSITQQDEPLVIAQPISEYVDFYSAARTPYYTASTLLQKLFEPQQRLLGWPSARQ
jgi:hypothetical protein